MGATLAIPAALGADPSPVAAARDGLPQDFELWQQAYDIVRDHYVDPAAASDEALVEGAIRGMVDALGDTGHTVYLTREELEAETEALDGTIIGIGITVDARAGSPAIISVLDGSPADKAGLRAGELILAVDGVRVDRSTTDELVKRVRGEPGTPVELRIRGRDGQRARGVHHPRPDRGARGQLGLRARDAHRGHPPVAVLAAAPGTRSPRTRRATRSRQRRRP